MSITAQQLPSPSKGTVLVVDDDALTRRLVKTMLARLGYDSDEVGDGEEALDALGHCEYAAVIMDCYMPKMDGFDATAALRKREGRTRHTPVIAMTVSGSSETAHRCGTVGVDSFLVKPLGQGDLEEILDYWTTRPLTTSTVRTGSD